MAHNSSLELSIVIPVFNEQGSIQKLYDEICIAVKNKYDYEIIFIDDGSSDNSVEILKKIKENDSRTKVILFRNNFGQTAALAAGFKYSSGNIIIPLDADGQNDPANIPQLIDKLNEGFDIVSGWRKKRHDKVITRRVPSRVANWVIAKITGVKLHDFGCTMKAYRANSIKQIRLYGEMHRFIPALASWGGEKVSEIVVNHRPRTTGKTKYGLSRTFKVILDLITIKFLSSYSTKPIHIFGGLGVLCGIGSIVSGLLVIYQKISSHFSMNRNPLLILTAMLFMASIQLILMGLMAELLVRTYHESQGRPIYVIDKILETEESTDES